MLPGSVERNDVTDAFIVRAARGAAKHYDGRVLFKLASLNRKYVSMGPGKMTDISKLRRCCVAATEIQLELEGLCTVIQVCLGAAEICGGDGDDEF